jgi:hypothetical protein
LEITGVAQKIKQVSKHIESEKELVETIYGCFEEITKSTKENIEELLKNKDIRIDQYGPARIRMLNFSLLLNIRSVLETEIVKNILNRINEVTDIRTTTHNKAVKPSQPKADKSSNEHIVVVAQTATKIAKDFDYTSLLEILPVLSEYTEFKSAIDSIHKKLFPLYEKELKLKFDSENPDIKEIDEYLEQCKMFGEKLILDSEIIKEHQEKYFKREKKEVHQKPDEGRVIEKTHAWKDLKDDF